MMGAGRLQRRQEGRVAAQDNPCGPGRVAGRMISSSRGEFRSRITRNVILDLAWLLGRGREFGKPVTESLSLALECTSAWCPTPHPSAIASTRYVLFPPASPAMST